MPYWICYYHFIWTTKHRAPAISATIETVILEAVERKSRTLGCKLHAVNTVPDHIHVAVSIPPKYSIAEWVQQVKGLSAYETNGHFPDLTTTFKWQEGYGALTFGSKNLPFVVAYIQNQKVHHQNQQLEPMLEYVE
jgi:putative transposase